MAKAKLSKMTESWVDGKVERQQSVKTAKQKSSDEKIKQTLYLSREAAKLLWHNRVENRESISQTVENLVTKHLRRN